MSATPPVRPWPLLAAAALIGMVTLSAFTVRLTGVGASTVATSAEVASRHLYFYDQSDGSIRIVDADTRSNVEVVAPGTNGFLRGTLRGLARERMRRHLDAREPFHLVAHQDGRLTLEDPATARQVELESFGSTNEAVFARLLVAPTPVEESRS